MASLTDSIDFKVLTLSPNKRTVLFHESEVPVEDAISVFGLLQSVLEESGQAAKPSKCYFSPCDQVQSLAQVLDGAADLLWEATCPFCLKSCFVEAEDCPDRLFLADHLIEEGWQDGVYDGTEGWMCEECVQARDEQDETRALLEEDAEAGREEE